MAIIRRLAGVILFVILLAGCSAEPSPSPLGKTVPSPIVAPTTTVPTDTPTATPTTEPTPEPTATPEPTPAPVVDDMEGCEDVLTREHSLRSLLTDEDLIRCLREELQ